MLTDHAGTLSGLAVNDATDVDRGDDVDDVVSTSTA
jgi:hypothetical protein